MGEGIDGSIAGYRILIKNTNDGNLALGRSSGNASYIISDSNFFDFGVDGSDWVHVVFTVSPTEMKYYKDGINVGTYSISNSSTINSDRDLQIMTDTEYNRFAGGQLDQIRIFNRTLDSGEITQLYNE